MLFFDSAEVLAAEGMLIVEHGRDENVLPELQRLERIRNQTYGSTTQLSIFCYRQDAGGGAE